jgi:hypothetical protein
MQHGDYHTTRSSPLATTHLNQLNPPHTQNLIGLETPSPVYTLASNTSIAPEANPTHNKQFHAPHLYRYAPIGTR